MIINFKIFEKLRGYDKGNYILYTIKKNIIYNDED